MTTPAEQSEDALNQVIQALAYAQSAKAVMEALTLFPDVAAEAVGVLFSIPQVRGLLRLQPASGAHAAVQATYRMNLKRRSAYLIQAALRMSTAIRNNGPGVIAGAKSAERRYLEQHLRADAGRVKAAEAVAAIAGRLARVARRDGSTWNGLVGWYAVMDERTSAECRRANGRNFDPRRVPRIGLPGAVHPSCRCRPGVPHVTDKRVETVRTPIEAVEGRRRAVEAPRGTLVR
jgi:hypothetical protein